MPSGRDMFKEQFERVLPATSVANLFPFNYSGKTDPHGIYLGADKFGSNIIVDFNRRSDDKTNANILIRKCHLRNYLPYNKVATKC